MRLIPLHVLMPVLIVALSLAMPVQALEARSKLTLQARHYLQAGAFVGQSAQQHPSLSLEMAFYHEWNQGRDSVEFTPFVRFDAEDKERRYADIRELKWLHVSDSFDLEVGLVQAFWGVTESQHLVDVINQWDGLGREDGEEKLGQAMVHLSAPSQFGLWELYLMPGFRERSFSGWQGRFRTPQPVDKDKARYESSAGRQRFEVALRWSHTLGDWDWGLAYFNGTQRDPMLQPSGQAQLWVPNYATMEQLSLDVQVTKGQWLWKHESLYRESRGHSTQAAVSGFEFTAVGLGAKRTNLGLLLEHNWHSEGNASTSLYQNDLFVGGRIAFNDAKDTTLLVGALRDLDTGSELLSLEGRRRINARWLAELDVRLLQSRGEDVLQTFADDDYVQLQFTYHF